MQKPHENVVQAQFGPHAQAYVDSAVHAVGADLESLDAIARALRPARALDLGTGGGHVSYLLAPHSETVTAVDLSPDMLAAVAAAARKKGLPNVETVHAPAERLPFGDGVFDFMASRYSAHHWKEFEQGLREAHRVLKPGGRAVFIDVCSPGPALLDTHLQAVELLRDTSHVRDYSTSEWIAALDRAHFAVGSLRTWRLRMDFPVWTARIATPPDNVVAIRALQESAPSEIRSHFEIEQDGSFHLDIAMLEATAR